MAKSKWLHSERPQNSVCLWPSRRSRTTSTCNANWTEKAEFRNTSRPPVDSQTILYSYLQWIQWKAGEATVEAMVRGLQGVCGGTSTANQPQWKLHLQDVESLELHVSTAEEGDTAALHGKKENKKKHCHKRNNPHRLPRNHKGVIVGRPGRSAAFSVVL